MPIKYLGIISLDNTQVYYLHLWLFNHIHSETIIPRINS